MRSLWQAIQAVRCCFSIRRLNETPKHYGENVDVYIIDTGVNKLSAFFGRRVRWKENYTSQDWTDIWGHGTQMASLIGGNKVGLSTRSKLYVYKIDTVDGTPDVRHLVKALRAVAQRHQRRRESRRYKGAVINLSLSLSLSISIIHDTEIQKLRAVLGLIEQRGILVVMAAGNDRGNLKDFETLNPCRWGESFIVVGAVDKELRLAEYEHGQGSNWHKDLTIFAPGKDLDGIDANGTEINNLEGTSAACAYVTGMVAVLMSGEKEDCRSAARVKKLLILNALHGKIPCLPEEKGPNLVADRTFPKAREGPWLGYRRSDAEIDEMIAEDLKQRLS